MNIPNILTTIRFFLIPIFVVVFYSPLNDSVLYATLIFALAGLTDFLDGYLARKYNMVTKWGIAMDPLADKLMLLTVLICFTSRGYLPIWVIIVVGIKEILMIFGALFLYYSEDKKLIPANKFGKVATISFYIAILSVAFKISETISFLLVLVAVVLTLIAFINYLLGFTKVKGESKNNQKSDMKIS